jgi:hypothetical protein
MPITADSIFLYSYFLCVALMAIVIPLCFYARRKAPGLGRSQRGNVRTDALSIFDLAGLAVFFGIYAVFLKEYLDPPQLDESGNRLEVNITPLILAVGMVVQFVPPLVVAVLLSARGIDLGKFFGIRWKNVRYLWVIAPIGVIITYLFLFSIELWGYGVWLEERFADDNKLQQTVKTYQEASAVTVRIMIAISAIIIAPVAEEIVFRGYIYTATKRFSNRFFAAILSSLLFGVVHFNISAFIPLVFLALLLTIAYELSGSIWAPISIHALFNASTILFQEFKFH